MVNGMLEACAMSATGRQFPPCSLHHPGQMYHVLTMIGNLLFISRPLPPELDGHRLKVGERCQDTAHCWAVQTATRLSPDHEARDERDRNERCFKARVYCAAPKKPANRPNIAIINMAMGCIDAKGPLKRIIGKTHWDRTETI